MSAGHQLPNVAPDFLCEAQDMPTKDPPSSVKVSQPEDLMALQVAALEATASAVVITDRKGILIWVNRAFEELTGYSRAEVVGRNTSLLKSDRPRKRCTKNCGGPFWREEYGAESSSIGAKTGACTMRE